MESTPRLMKVIAAANQNEPKSARKMASMRIKRKTYLVDTAQANDLCPCDDVTQVWGSSRPNYYLNQSTLVGAIVGLFRVRFLTEPRLTISLPRACKETARRALLASAPVLIPFMALSALYLEVSSQRRSRLMRRVQVWVKKTSSPSYAVSSASSRKSTEFDEKQVRVSTRVFHVPRRNEVF